VRIVHYSNNLTESHLGDGSTVGFFWPKGNTVIVYPSPSRYIINFEL